MNAPSGDATYAALAVVSRRRLLKVLRAADKPLDVAGLAAAVGLHVTTARFHLDVLERAGLVRRAGQRGGRAGRPRLLYAAVADSATREGQRQLAEVLAGMLAVDPDGPSWAEQAGRLWAERRVPADAGLPWDEGTRWVGDLFDRLGFAPRLVEDAQRRWLELAACPFRDLARAYPDIVCTVHLGLLRGALSRLRVPSAEDAGLRPFVEAELCIVEMPSPTGRKAEQCPEPVP